MNPLKPNSDPFLITRRILAAVIFFLTICVSLPSLTSTAQAQDAGADTVQEQTTENQAASAPAKKELTLWQMYKIGGWTMHFLLLCWIGFLSLTIYNAIALRPKKVLAQEMLPQINEAVERLDIEKVLSLCADNPGMLTNVLRAGFARASSGEISLSSIQSGMEEAAPEEVQKTMTTVNYLSTIAVISPMLGLLGTVSGMIKAFRAMALGGMGRPELLADNISEALITTATGLIVGIPAMIAYYFFKYRLSGMVAAISRIGGDMIERLKYVMKNYAGPSSHEVSSAGEDPVTS